MLLLTRIIGLRIIETCTKLAEENERVLLYVPWAGTDPDTGWNPWKPGLPRDNGGVLKEEPSA